MFRSLSLFPVLHFLLKGFFSLFARASRPGRSSATAGSSAGVQATGALAATAEATTDVGSSGVATSANPMAPHAVAADAPVLGTATPDAVASMPQLQRQTRRHRAWRRRAQRQRARQRRARWYPRSRRLCRISPPPAPNLQQRKSWRWSPVGGSCRVPQRRMRFPSHGCWSGSGGR